MNLNDDTFEAELAGWQPAPISEKLKQRIGLDMGRIVPFRRRAWLMGGGLVAACLLVVLLLRIKQDDFARLRPTASMATESSVEPFDQLPSLRVYTHALNQSADVLDALLDRHGAFSNMTTDFKTPLKAFSLSQTPFTN
jgi:hypothetical protein